MVGRARTLRDAARLVRRKVFVDEQGVPEDEAFDGADGRAVHVVAFTGEEPLATARRLELESRIWRVGQVAVLEPARGLGTGTLVMRAALKHVVSCGGVEIVLAAQSGAAEFYRRLGFAQCAPGDALESGVVLVPMSLTL